jgi:hypothetical protein
LLRTDSTRKEAEAFGRAQVAQLIASEAKHGNQEQEALDEPLSPPAIRIRPISPVPRPASEALGSKDYQDLINQIQSLQVEVAKLKNRQQVANQTPPPAFDPIMERFLAGQRLVQVELTPSMMTETASIVPPPYALSDVGAKDCLGERYENAPASNYVRVSEGGEYVTLHRVPGGDTTLGVPTGRQVTMYRLTNAEAVATTALMGQRRHLDYL